MKIRIESNGDTNDTKVFDNETGKQIGWIKRIVWSADADDHTTKCTIEIMNPLVSVTTEAEVKEVPALPKSSK